MSADLMILPARLQLKEGIPHVANDLQVDVFHVDGKLAQLSSEFQTAISSRHCVHPTVPVLAAGTASGRMLVYR